MVNYDKNIQGAKRDAARQAHEAKLKAKQDKEDARRAAAKAKREEKNRELLESIAEQIDTSEEHAYGDVYDQLCEDGAPSVTDPQVLQFLADHTDIDVQKGAERLTDALRQVLAPGQEELPLPQFLDFLRENAVYDSTAVSKFLETCHGDTLPKTEATAVALHVAQRMVTITFEKEKWDVLLHAVMGHLAETVSLQDFVVCCKKLARCARLLQFLELEAQDDLPALSGKRLQQWKALAEEVAQRLQQQPGLRRAGAAPRSPAKEEAPEAAPGLADVQCDLCRAGLCTAHNQPHRGQGASSKAEQGAKASSKPLLLSNKAEARQVLGEAITKVSELAMQLEDAILAAFDAGLEEDELLPAFVRLEELRRGVACC